MPNTDKSRIIKIKVKELGFDTNSYYILDDYNFPSALDPSIKISILFHNFPLFPLMNKKILKNP